MSTLKVAAGVLLGGALLVVIAGGVLVATGNLTLTGSETAEAAKPLTDQERANLYLLQSQISTGCADQIAGGSSSGEADAALDKLVSLARAKPEAQFEGGTMSDLVTDTASELDQCWPDAAARLDRVANDLR